MKEVKIGLFYILSTILISCGGNPTPPEPVVDEITVTHQNSEKSQTAGGDTAPADTTTVTGTTADADDTGNDAAAPKVNDTTEVTTPPENADADGTNDVADADTTVPPLPTHTAEADDTTEVTTPKGNAQTADVDGIAKMNAAIASIIGTDGKQHSGIVTPFSTTAEALAEQNRYPKTPWVRPAGPVTEIVPTQDDTGTDTTTTAGAGDTQTPDADTIAAESGEIPEHPAYGTFTTANTTGTETTSVGEMDQTPDAAKAAAEAQAQKEAEEAAAKAAAEAQAQKEAEEAAAKAAAEAQAQKEAEEAAAKAAAEAQAQKEAEEAAAKAAAEAQAQKEAEEAAAKAAAEAQAQKEAEEAAAKAAAEAQAQKEAEEAAAEKAAAEKAEQICNFKDDYLEEDLPFSGPYFTLESSRFTIVPHIVPSGDFQQINVGILKDNNMLSFTYSYDPEGDYGDWCPEDSQSCEVTVKYYGAEIIQTALNDFKYIGAVTARIDFNGQMLVFTDCLQ